MKKGSAPEATDLTLLTRKTVQTQKSFATRGAQFGHDAAKLADTAGIAARANHLQEAGGTQAGILLQGLAQKVEIGIGEPVAQAGMTAETVRVQGGAHGFGMQAEFGGNGADLPMLGMKQGADFSDLLIGNHVSPRERDRSSALGSHRSDRRPIPRGGTQMTMMKAPFRSWHKERGEGKIDPSRKISSVGDTLVGGRGDRHVSRDSVDGGGWPRGAGGGGLFHGNGNRNNAGRGHNGGRDRTPRRREENEKKPVADTTGVLLLMPPGTHPTKSRRLRKPLRR